MTTDGAIHFLVLCLTPRLMCVMSGNCVQNHMQIRSARKLYKAVRDFGPAEGKIGLLSRELEDQELADDLEEVIEQEKTDAETATDDFREQMHLPTRMKRRISPPHATTS